MYFQATSFVFVQDHKAPPGGPTVTQAPDLPTAPLTPRSWKQDAQFLPQLLHRRDQPLPLCHSPVTSASKSTTTAHYSLWQGTREHNQDLDNAQIYAFHKPYQTSSSSGSSVFRWTAGVEFRGKGRQPCHRRFSGGLDRTDGSPLL